MSHTHCYHGQKRLDLRKLIYCSTTQNGILRSKIETQNIIPSPLPCSSGQLHLCYFVSSTPAVEWDRGVGCVSSSHIISTIPSSSGEELLTHFPCSSVDPFQEVQFFRNRLLHHGIHGGPQVLSTHYTYMPQKSCRSLLWCGFPTGSQPSVWHPSALE